MRHGDAVKTIKHGDYTIYIHQDEDAPNPRKEYDNAGTMICFHRRYSLGDEHNYRDSDFSGWDEIQEQIEQDYGKLAVILPLGLYDHSGITMYIGSGSIDHGGWDSGQVGFIFITREKAIAEWGKRRLTKHVREMAEKCLRSEVETYDQYLTGDVYGYVIEDEDGKEVDSCWGMFGFEYCKQAAIDSCPKDKEPTGDVPLRGSLAHV